MKIVLNGGSASLSSSDRLRIIKDAMERGESYVVNNDERKGNFIYEVAQTTYGKSNDFYKDVYVMAEYSKDSSRYKGRCGYELCSDRYIEYVEKNAFGESVSSYCSGSLGSRDYRSAIENSLKNVAKQINDELNQCERNNDYIKDENAKNLRELLRELNNCGISTYFNESKITSLAWFVGGNSYKIKEFQKNLNRLGITNNIKEDGVYGTNTLKAWNDFTKTLVSGSVPTLTWIDPLKQKDLSLDLFPSKEMESKNIKNTIRINKGRRYIRVDNAHPNQTVYYRGKKVKADYKHLNFDKLKSSNAIYDYIHKQYNHYPLSDTQYNFLKDLDKAGKKVRIGGKVLLVTGIVMDTIELGKAIETDISNQNKLGITTYSTAINIGGRWGGSVLCAKIGGTIGATTGPAAPITIPVFAFVGGVVGSIAGDKLTDLVIDITNVE